MGQRLADYRLFWRQFREAYHTTGAVLPSGPALCAALVRYVHNVAHRPNEVTSAPTATGAPSVLQPTRRILEIGPGTGAVTAHIARAMSPDDRLTLIERNKQFVDHLRAQLDSAAEYRQVRNRVELIHGSLEDLGEGEPFDVVISGLPLNNFSVELVDCLLRKMRTLLARDGVLSFFEYVAIRRVKAVISSHTERERLRGIARILRDLFSRAEIRRDLVVLNVPPAWVHHVQASGEAES